MKTTRCGKLGRFLVCATLLGIGVAQLADAAKPPALPPVVEPGTRIYLQLSSLADYSMADNGTNQVLVLDSAVAQGVPSSLKYVGEHLWLWRDYREDDACYPNTEFQIWEMFVGVPGVWKQRITNLWAEDGLIPQDWAWSNDGEDSFISITSSPLTYESYDEFGNPIGLPVVGPHAIYQMSFDSTLATSSQVIGFIAPNDAGIGIHTWSPDGSTVVYCSYVNVSGTNYPCLYRHSLADVIADIGPTLVWRHSIAYSQDMNPQYSRDGQKIAFSKATGTYTRDIVTVSADAVGLINTGTTTILSGRSKGYQCPKWSPSGNYLVATEIDSSKPFNQPFPS